MNKLLLFLSLFMLSVKTSFAQNANRGLSTQNNNSDSIATNFALVVGISSYANIKHLLYADDDAYLFAEYLINEKICERKNVVRLIDSVATTANFYKELTRLKNKILPNDRVFIYFAGHGDVETDLESGFLLTYNCESTNYPATAIDISMLEKYVNAFVNKKAKVVLITDACRSGNLAGGLSGASTTMSSIIKGFQNIVKILSCQPTQLSLEKDYPGGGHGVFTYNLVEGLSGMADTDGDSSISLREIGFYLDKVRTETNKKQIPKVEGDPEKNIANFDKSILLALLEKKNSNTSVAVNLSRKERGGEDSTWISNSYYQAFNEHIRKLRFIEPQGKNAYFTIEEASKNKQPADLIGDMKLVLSALLEDEAQKWINKYMRSELENKINDILTDLIKVKKYLETIESMIGEKDLRFTEIHVKKIFFDDYYKYKKNDTASYMKSVEELEKTNKLLPNQAWIFNLIGNLNRQLRKYSESEIALKKAIKLAPSWSYPWLNLGSLYYDSKKYIEAEAAFTRAIQVNNNDAYTWSYLGIIYYDSKKYTQAELAYKKAILIDSNYVYPWHNLGLVYRGLNNYLQAEASIKKAIQIDSNYASAWNYLGLIYFDQKKFTEAEATFKKAIQIDSNIVYPWNNLGLVYYGQKKYTEAEASHKKAIQIDSTYSDAWNSLGNLYRGLKKYIEAEVAYKKAIQIDSTIAHFWYNLGLNYNSLKKSNEAEAAYKRAILIDSNSISPWYTLANFYRIEKKYIEAEAAYKKAIQIDSNVIYLWNALGIFYNDREKYTEAEVAFKKAIRIDSNNFSSWFNLGYLYSDLKNYTDAEVAYKKALQVNPEISTTYYNLACLYSIWEKQELALEFLELSIKKGFDDFSGIETDLDLDNIRNAPAFKELIKKYKK